MSENYANRNRGELEKLLAEKRQALRQLRFGAAGGKIANVKASRGLRQDIARILTNLK